MTASSCAVLIVTGQNMMMTQHLADCPTVYGPLIVNCDVQPTLLLRTGLVLAISGAGCWIKGKLLGAKDSYLQEQTHKHSYENR